MRQIKINKYEGNTHYSVNVIDSYGKEHHLGYYKHIYTNKLEEKAQEIWSNEVKPVEDLLAKAIAQCIELDKKHGVKPNLE
jgi:predicted metallo-beta-lactamase superfamily hydrolase